MKELAEISGVGPKTLSLFHKVGIYNLDDLLSYYPRKYRIVQRSDMSKVLNGDKVIIDGIVEGQPSVSSVSRKLKKILFRFSSGNNIYNIVAFNQLYLCNELKPGMAITVFGKFDQSRNMIVVQEIRKGKLPNRIQIESSYALTEGLTKHVLTKAIYEVIESGFWIEDHVPSYLKERYHFPEKMWSILMIHTPEDILSYKRALQRLKYEEFFWYLLRLRYLKQCTGDGVTSVPRVFDVEKLSWFIDRLPFSLTRDQWETVKCIQADFLSSKRMNRLVQGDVGSGKTIVAFIACYMNYLSGYQTALMVPTEILVNQHYQAALELFRGINIKICLLTSSTTFKEKSQLYQKIREGEVDFVIGTQSLIQEGLEYCNLGLIITDEQHRFGVNQRELLKNKGAFPDVLSMSATPIPRTYAFTIYGDMDVSSIKAKPAGRKEIITYFKREKDLLEVLSLMKKELDEGHQIYVIAPAIENADEDILGNVIQLKEKMILAFGKIARVDIVHGKLLSFEKNQTMKEFEQGNINILISTTVIEVGVNVPNASMIVIFQANLFGLSTLHQLRGRVGRGDTQGYCILVAKEDSEKLKMLESCSDGFEISEYDFKTRGEGDLFGIRQSGDVPLKLANIKKDYDLLLRVKRDVDEFWEDKLFEKDFKYLLEQLSVDILG